MTPNLCRRISIKTYPAKCRVLFICVKVYQSLKIDKRTTLHFLYFNNAIAELDGSKKQNNYV